MPESDNRFSGIWEAQLMAMTAAAWVAQYQIAIFTRLTFNQPEAPSWTNRVRGLRTPLAQRSWRLGNRARRHTRGRKQTHDETREERAQLD